MKADHTISDDLKLIRLFQEEGDLKVLGQLYKPYMHLVYGVSLKYLKDQVLAQDAVMHIFEELIIKIPKHDIKNFKSWLYVLTKNHCLMALRKSNKKSTMSTEENTSMLMEIGSDMHHDSREEKIMLEDNLERLELCISQLKDEQKRCVELFFLQQKSYQEIEILTAFEIKKIKSYIQNGKRNLKICMESNV